MLFAITSHEPDYKLCHKLNQALHINLEKEEALELKNKKQADNLLFSLYCFVDDDEQLEYNLLSNKSFNTVLNTKQSNSPQTDLFGGSDPEVSGSKGLLLNELQNCDYLLILRTPYDAELAHDLEQKIKAIDGIIKIQYIEVGDLASRSNLIF